MLKTPKTTYKLHKIKLIICKYIAYCCLLQKKCQQYIYIYIIDKKYA